MKFYDRENELGRINQLRTISREKGGYYIDDNFKDFWFRHIDARRSLKEINRIESAFERIMEQLPEYEGRKLEDMVIRKITPKALEGLKHNAANVLEFRGFEILIGAAYLAESGVVIELME